MRNAKLLLVVIIFFSTIGALSAFKATRYQTFFVYYRLNTFSPCTLFARGYSLQPIVQGQASAGVWRATTVYNGICTTFLPYYTAP